MAHHHMTAFVLDLLQIGNVLKQTLCSGAELSRIVIAAYQHFVARKRLHKVNPLVFLLPNKVAKNIYGIVCLYTAVPVVNNSPVHFV